MFDMRLCGVWFRFCSGRGWFAFGGFWGGIKSISRRLANAFRQCDSGSFPLDFSRINELSMPVL